MVSRGVFDISRDNSSTPRVDLEVASDVDSIKYSVNIIYYIWNVVTCYSRTSVLDSIHCFFFGVTLIICLLVQPNLFILKK